MRESGGKAIETVEGKGRGRGDGGGWGGGVGENKSKYTYVRQVWNLPMLDPQTKTAKSSAAPEAPPSSVGSARLGSAPLGSAGVEICNTQRLNKR